MDGFYPVVSFMAFLSGGCFGFYYAWRTGRARVAERASQNGITDIELAEAA
jgi:hypothetical protein